MYDRPRPLPICHGHTDNIALLERSEQWLWGDGISELVIRLYHIPMAGHVFGLKLKHHTQLNLDQDWALRYVRSKGTGATWIKNCRNSLNKFRRFLRLERGLGEESRVTPFDIARAAAGLLMWVTELEHYQHLLRIVGFQSPPV